MSHSSPLERLVYEVQGLIVELKKEYFATKKPLDDDEILVHKLCVRLENVLRYGSREKYTFMGIRKDYFNFFSESLSKDETVRFIQSIPDFKTNPGKGRAFLRHALMEKSLADTLQRSIINTRITKDYYGNESVMRSEVHFLSLLHSLYDLNAVDFLLPHQGYDLDKNFPSFVRKSFREDGTTASRRPSSTSSINSVQSNQPDPIQILRTNVSLLELVINAWLGKVTEHTEDKDDDVPLLLLINKLSLLREHVILLKTRSNNEHEVLKSDIEKLKEDKLKLEAYMGQRLSLAHDHYKSIHTIESSATDEKVKNMSERLSNTEQILVETREKHDDAVLNITTLLAESQEKCESVQLENNKLTELVEKYRIDLEYFKENNQSYLSTNKILENKLSELQKINNTLKSSEKEKTEANQQLEQSVKIKETELRVLQDAFEKSTGLVAGSVEELKIQLYSHQAKTSEVLTSTNEGLLSESKSLLNTINELTSKLQVLEEKLVQETNKKEEVEKIVSDLKSKYTEDMKYQCELQHFMSELWNLLNGDSEELGDIEGDGLMKKSIKYNKETTFQKLVELQNNVVEWKQAKEVAEKEVVQLKEKLMKLTETWEESQKEENDEENRYKELEEENDKLKLDIQACNGKIYDMSVDVINLNESLVRKQGDFERERIIIVQLQNEVQLIKEEKEELLQNIKTLEEEIAHLSVGKENLLEELKCGATKETTLVNELVTLKQERENTYAVALQEVQALKFQLSTEEIKMVVLTKELTDAVKQKETAQSDLSVLTESFNELESTKSMENVSWSSQKETLVAQCEKLTHQCDDLTNKYTIAEKEITFLKVELAKLAKEKVEEKTLRLDLSNQIEESKSKEEEYLSTVNQNTQDLTDIKTLLVNSTQEKHDLWQKNELLEQELSEVKERPAERWITDTEVFRCTSCNEIFSLTRRKHHCRLCGQIFCNECSNRWIKTQQSRKRVRACANCADMREETSEKIESGSFEDHLSDMNSTISEGRSFVGSDEEVSDTEKIVAAVKIADTITENPCEETSTGTFEILGAEEVSTAGSFGNNEEIKILTTDLIKSSLIPACHTDDELPVEKENVTMDVTAGIRVLLPVIVPGSNLDLSWEFTSTPKDVGFGVAFKPPEEESDDCIQTVVPLSRYISHKLIIHGKMSIVNPGTYYLIFDNSYSRLTTKVVTCIVGLARSKQS